MGQLDNDTRGWIMAVVSGIACTFGASIICVDLIIRQFPGQKHFKIEDSNPFLSSGLSLSFGVMIFSSLYSMLPSSKKYLEKGGLSPKAAMFTLVGCFLAGALGISILSRILHQYIPHSVVDCDHEHDDEEGKADEPPLEDSHQPRHSVGEQQRRHSADNEDAEELGRHLSYSGYGSTTQNSSSLSARRPSLHAQISSLTTQLVSGVKEMCDANGQCKGFSNPCGQDCFKNVKSTRFSRFHPLTGKLASAKFPTRPLGQRTQTMPHDVEREPLLPNVDETAPLAPIQSGPAAARSLSSNGHTRSALRKQSSSHSLASSSSSHAGSQHHSHHHHVPTNAFLSIGLQTSTAIALHKIPEGFITYATNHANPSLGFSVFLALFIHNITEGFAMALPLYLAINSRWKAMFWSALLGGVSQPLGAGVAALWFKVAGKGDEPGEVVYGVLFAVTAGIMAMVGLQLFGESLELTHSRRLCFASAFVGMGILGVSSALTAS